MFEGTPSMWMIIIVASAALMVLAGQMARVQGRSVKGWVWTTAVVGPLGPLALYVVGATRRDR